MCSECSSVNIHTNFSWVELLTEPYWKSCHLCQFTLNCPDNLWLTMEESHLKSPLLHFSFQYFYPNYQTCQMFYLLSSTGWHQDYWTKTGSLLRRAPNWTCQTTRQKLYLNFFLLAPALGRGGAGADPRTLEELATWKTDTFTPTGGGGMPE